MQAAEGVMTSLPMQRAVDAIAHQVREGVTLSRALSAIGGFPPVLVHLVASGEATGRLAQMLERAADEQARELSRRVQTFTALLGPAVVLLMGAVVLGIVLAIVTLLASIGLLTLSGWFLSGSAVAGFAGLYSFNYMLPAAGVRGTAITRTAGRYFERLVSHDATFRVLQHLRIYTFSKLLPLSPAGLARFRQGELLNRVVADVDTLDHLYLRVISPIVGAFVVIVVVTLGLSVLDVSVALTLGGIMLLTLIILPPLFYRAGKSTGENLTRLRGDYRQQLTSWLQGQAELTIFGASKRYRARMESTELNWHEAQRRQSELTAFSQALMMLIGVRMSWLMRETNSLLA